MNDANYTDELKITLDANGGEHYGWFWDDDMDVSVPDPDNDQVIVLESKMGTAVKLGKTRINKRGYSFVGWSTRRNGTPLKGSDKYKTFTYAPKQDCTLYAVYKKTEYVVAYSANGGYLAGNYTDYSTDKTVKNGTKTYCLMTIGEKAPLDCFNVKHKNATQFFAGWSTSKTGKSILNKSGFFAEDYKPSKNCTLYADQRI